MKVLSDILHKAGILKEGAEAYSSGGYSVVVRNATTQRFETVASTAFANIYTSDGSLTGNRVVDGGGFSLTLNPVLTFGERLTGITNKTYTNSYTGTTTTTPSAFLISNDITHTGATNYTANIHYNSTYATNTGASGSGALAISVFNESVYLRGLTSSAMVQSRNFIAQRRDDAADVSTNANNTLEGVGVFQTHWQTAGSTIYTGIIWGFNNQINIRSGSVGTAVAHRSGIYVGQFTSNVTLVNNYYAFYSESQVGTSSGSSATITNYYGLFLNTPTVNATGSITNRWGVYAPDVSMRHYLNGNVLIGTTTDAGFKLDVQGTARVTGNINAPSLVNSSSSLNLGINNVTTYSISTELFRAGGSSGWLIAQFFGSGITQGSYGVWVDQTNGRLQLGAASRYILNLHSTNDNVSIDSQGVNPASAASALFQVNSTTKGFLQPRMTTTQRDAIATPATGLSIYNTTTNTSDFYNGTSWISGGINIYNSDGTLTGNRLISAGANNLAIQTNYAFSANNANPSTNIFNVKSSTNENAISVWSNGAVGIGRNAGSASAVNGYALAVDNGNNTGIYTGGLYSVGQISANNNSITLGIYGNKSIQFSDGASDGYVLYTAANGIIVSSGAYAGVKYNTTVQVNGGAGLRIFGPTGNAVVGGPTFADAGYKLDVQGNTRIKSNDYSTTLLIDGAAPSIMFTSTNGLYIYHSNSSFMFTVNSGTTAFSGLIIGQGYTASQSVAYGGIAIGGYHIAKALDVTALAVGKEARALSNMTTSLGVHAVSNNSSSCAIHGGYTTASNQLVIGGAISISGFNANITEVYFGSGPNNGYYASGTTGNVTGIGVSYSINGSGAFGTDFAGGNITIAGGKGTGTGTPGDVIFSTATTTSTGTTLQTLTNRVWIKGENGNVGIGSSPNAAYKLDVVGTGRFSNTLSVISTATTNETAIFRSVEPYITIEAAGGSNSASIFLKPSTSSQNATIQNRTGGGLEFYTGATPSLAATITAANNLVIGTVSAAGQKLQVTSASADSHLLVWGATAPSIRIDNAATGSTQRFVLGLATATNNFITGAVAGDICLTTQSSSPLLFGANATEVMRLSTSSNVLIGKTTDGGQRLQVNGKVNLASLPTSASGLSSGDLWNNGGVINIV